MNCLNCGCDLSELDFPYGEDIECPKCKEILRTDWDYDETLGVCWWIIEIKDYK